VCPLLSDHCLMCKKLVLSCKSINKQQQAGAIRRRKRAGAAWLPASMHVTCRKSSQHRSDVNPKLLQV
jgi:hypothetical protein